MKQDNPRLEQSGLAARGGRAGAQCADSRRCVSCNPLLCLTHVACLGEAGRTHNVVKHVGVCCLGLLKSLNRFAWLEEAVRTQQSANMRQCAARAA